MEPISKNSMKTNECPTRHFFSETMRLHLDDFWWWSLFFISNCLLPILWSQNINAPNQQPDTNQMVKKSMQQACSKFQMSEGFDFCFYDFCLRSFRLSVVEHL